jgi:hypothetical protein
MDIDLHESLSAGMPGLEPTLGSVLANAATVCLADRSHNSPVELSIRGCSKRKAKLSWNHPSQQMKKSYADMQEATEWGASGVAIAILSQIEGTKVLERARKGKTFDYWIATDASPGLLFQGKSHLEVSGILNGSKADVDRRVKLKQQQVKKSPLAIVAVVEFGAPQACIKTNGKK